MLKTVLSFSGVHVDTKSDLFKVFIDLWDGRLKDILKSVEGMDIDLPAMADVPKKALENPYVFLKFWEKRFNKGGEEYRRKMAKVAARLINDLDN